MADTINVAIAGIAGRMGRSSAQAILGDSNLKLVGAFDRPGSEHIGQPLNRLLNPGNAARADILVSSGFAECQSKSKIDVVLDFTEAKSALALGLAAVAAKVRPVIGTSGIPADGLKSLEQASSKEQVGALVVPNFSIGAILMMAFARQAARLFDSVEVVETHKLGKLDAPSGTAMHTVREIELAGKEFNKASVNEHVLVDGARGGISEHGVHVHSIRMPGVLSHQDVIFGAEGEMLSIRHDSFNTNCFNRGIILAIKSVMNLNSLAVGLEKFVLAG